ncbi:hypothetical protein D3C87_1646090 [compost metagenome]
MDKAREIAQLGEDAYRRGELHTAHGLQAQYGRIEVPVDHGFAQGRFETVALGEPILDGPSIFVKGKLLPHGVERKGTDPAPVRRSPVGSAGVANTVREQKGFQPLSGPLQIVLGADPSA